MEKRGMDLMFLSRMAYGFARIGFQENLEFEFTGDLTVFQSHDVPARSEGSSTLCLDQWYRNSHTRELNFAANAVYR